MVLISLKPALGGDTSNDSFLYETKLSTTVDDLIQSLVDIHNARLRARLIIESVKELAMYGIMNHPDEDQIHEVEDIHHDHNQVSDPSGRRSGNPPASGTAELLKREVEALEIIIGGKQVLTIGCLEEKFNKIRDSVISAYPMGLPDWDSAKIALDGTIESLNGTLLGKSFIDAKDAALWTCNKEFLRGTLVSDRVGSHNEKTKLVAKLTKKDAGPPAREPLVSEAERNAMTAFYFQRQEELKRLAQADDDDYLNSQWADPKGLKRNLQGLNDLKTSTLRF